MHPDSLKIFEKIILIEDTDVQYAALNNELSEEKVPNFEMAALIFSEVKQLVLIHQRGVIEGMKKIANKI